MLGFLIFKVNNKICFCNNFLPGEIGLVEKNKYDKYYISSFSKTSKDRVESECDYYSKCGGCHLLHMNKQLQKKFKIDYVQTAFTEKKLNSKIDEYIEPDSYKGYRNKMQVAYKFQEGKLVYGFYEEESHKIIPMKKCIVQTERQNEIAKVTYYYQDVPIGTTKILLSEDAVKSYDFHSVNTRDEFISGRPDNVIFINIRLLLISILVLAGICILILIIHSLFHDRRLSRQERVRRKRLRKEEKRRNRERRRSRSFERKRFRKRKRRG